MSKKVAALDLSKVIAQTLLEYGDEATAACRKSVPKVAKETVSILKQTSPRGVRGKYAKSWRAETVLTRNGAESTIYSNKEYRLTHLLEKGHAKRGGGRTKAIPHISEAETKAGELLGEMIRKELGQ